MKNPYIVLNNDEELGTSPEYRERYLALREELFGYAKVHPEVRTRKSRDAVTGMGTVELRNGHLGLVRTYDEAQVLRDQLKKEFPEAQLEILEVEYPHADSIHFYRSR